jgi:tetratricopeptide (TPR) repeat protein
MARSIGYVMALGAGAILLGLALAVPQAFAVEDTDDSGGAKGGQAKSCPKGARYSEKKHGCVRTSCGTGQVWSSGVDACLDGNSAALTDEDLYLAAGDLVLEARYADALPLLFRIKDRNNPQVLNLIGYSTRKLGDIDKGIDYYHQALAIDPNYTKARQYLGEAYLQKDDVERAKEQLMEIADRCGGPCDDYELLVKAIAAHVTGEPIVGW